MLATARQIDGCDGNVSEQVYGTKGVAQLMIEERSRL